MCDTKLLLDSIVENREFNLFKNILELNLPNVNSNEVILIMKKIFNRLAVEDVVMFLFDRNGKFMTGFEKKNGKTSMRYFSMPKCFSIDVVKDKKWHLVKELNIEVRYTPQYVGTPSVQGTYSDGYRDFMLSKSKQNLNPDYLQGYGQAEQDSIAYQNAQPDYQVGYSDSLKDFKQGNEMPMFSSQYPNFYKDGYEKGYSDAQLMKEDEEREKYYEDGYRDFMLQNEPLFFSSQYPNPQQDLYYSGYYEAEEDSIEYENAQPDYQAGYNDALKDFEQGNEMPMFSSQEPNFYKDGYEKGYSDAQK